MSESAATPVLPKRRRCWLRFGLRTFLVLVALAGAGLGWKVRQVHLQRAAVEWVRANGGKVYYDYERDSDPMRPDANQPGPVWLRSLGGIDYVAHPVAVDLRANHVVLPPNVIADPHQFGNHVVDVAPLANLHGLQSLDLTGTQVADLTPLAKLTGLQRLYLSGTRVVDVSPLAKLSELESLHLSDTQVADVFPLAKLTGLQDLDLSGTQVADLVPLANLPALQSLDLSRTQVSDVAPLAGLTTLWFLKLSYTQVSDVTPLAKLTRLGSVKLRGTLVSDEDIAELQRALHALPIIH